MINKIYYVAEINPPNSSAYSIHVMKMCEAFSKLNNEVQLYVINGENKKRKDYLKKNAFKTALKNTWEKDL